MLLLRLSILLVCFSDTKGQVIEMDEKFPQVQLDDAWLMEFYAPWCGHCKHLEPIYHQVYLELRTSAVKVARVDATKHPSMATLYGVRGFPTIKFIRGDSVITYNGERTKKALMEFVKKALGGPVRVLSSTQHLLEEQRRLFSQVFFVLVKADSLVESSNLESQFQNSSHKHMISNDFFTLSSPLLLPQKIKLASTPTIIAFQEDVVKEIPADLLEGGVEDWVERERWGWVACVGAMGLHQVSNLGKSLLILVQEPQDRLYEMTLSVAKDNGIFSKKYQFVHLSDVEAGNNIIISHLPPPFFILLYPSTHFYHLPISPIHTEKDLKDFIADVESGKNEVMGGSGVFVRIKRMIYAFKNVIYNMWEESVWLTMLLLGVPCLIVAIISYTICCLDVGDDVTFEEEEEDDGAAGEDEDNYGNEEFHEDQDKKIL